MLRLIRIDPCPECQPDGSKTTWVLRGRRNPFYTAESPNVVGGGHSS